MTYILHKRGSIAPAAPFACAPVKRFDALYWTVDFPRPAMAALTNPATTTMRVDCAFYHKQELVGLIWEAEDRWDHPLLAYETSRDFRGCQLSFRLRSAGVKAMDALHGPTLTIEGRDASGAARSWYVRLWNYAAAGSAPEDARIRLDFDTLEGGFLHPAESDPVWAGDIERMFISLVPPEFDGGAGALAVPAEGWAEMSDIVCDGSGSVLRRGDVMLPEHGLSIATGYDDAYNLAPGRVVRNAMALGYRGAINHYVGMSHYFRLGSGGLVDGPSIFRQAQDSGPTVSNPLAGVLNGPCDVWHRAFAKLAHEAGFGIIWSLSYELFNAHCPEEWKQRAADGSPALTGWEPPSALLSPSHQGAMDYLKHVARAFMRIAMEAGLAPRFQVGEPWWWVRGDGSPCLYDEATSAALGALSVPIASLKGPLDADQIVMLDACGGLLAASTLALTDAARDEAGAAGCETVLLVYLPTVLDADMPEARRANVPQGWAFPAFDVLQLEDYDWAAEGRDDLTTKGVAAMEARLSYPVERQHYLSGFVLRPEEARRQWSSIDRAAVTAKARGVAVTFIWALPQVCRDGFTHFSISKTDDEEMPVRNFDNVDFPIAIGREASVLTEFSTAVVESASGHEQRMVDWSNARMRFDAGPGVRSEDDVAALVAFFRARQGRARSFRFRDPFDGSSAPQGGPVTAFDQPLAIADGVTKRFGLFKLYGGAGAANTDAQRRPVTRPVAGTIRVGADGVELTSGWVHHGMGVIQFDEMPAKGTSLTVGFEYDVPVRFASDTLEVSRSTFRAGEIASVPLVEVREV